MGSSRRFYVAVLVALVAVLGGCTGAPGLGEPTKVTTTEQSAPLTETTTTRPGTGATTQLVLSVVEARNQTRAARTDRVAKSTFENLSERRQVEFRAAIGNGGQLSDPDAWQPDDPDRPYLVRYRGTWYVVNFDAIGEASTTRSAGSATTYLYVERARQNVSLGESDAATYENLSAGRQNEFLQAIENDGRLTDPTAWERRAPSQPRFVRYDGVWYEVYVAVT